MYSIVSMIRLIKSGHSNALIPFCLTEDDQQYLANNATQHVYDYQALLENCHVCICVLSSDDLFIWLNH